MKRFFPFLLISTMLVASCGTTCYKCVYKPTGEVLEELCSDEPHYSTSYRDNFRYTCELYQAEVEVYKK